MGSPTVCSSERPTTVSATRLKNRMRRSGFRKITPSSSWSTTCCRCAFSLRVDRRSACSSRPRRESWADSSWNSSPPTTAVASTGSPRRMRSTWPTMARMGRTVSWASTMAASQASGRATAATARLCWSDAVTSRRRSVVETPSRIEPKKRSFRVTGSAVS